MLFNKRKIAILILITLLLSLFFVCSVSGEGGLFSGEGSDELTDGIYNICNKDSGLYLEVYDYSTDASGRAYLSNRNGKDGQSFLIKRQDNGQYLVYPQNENGMYVLSYSNDIMDGQYIYKTGAATNQSVFNITLVEDDCYTIKPSGMSDSKLAVGQISEKTKQGGFYAGVTLSDIDEKTQWTFEKITSEYIAISGGYCDIKVGESKELSAALYPEYLVGNLIWSSSDENIASVDAFGNVTGVSDGETLINVNCGGTTASTKVRVSSKTAYTWYSQHNIYSGGWYAEPIADLNIICGSSRKLCINGFNKDSDWFDEGCKICSVAMVLNNLGAKLSVGYDMRNGAVNNLPVDPYIVVLANIGSDGYNVDNSVVTNPPNNVSFNLIAPRFKVDGKSLKKTQKYNVTREYIKEQLELHPEGVIVEMNISSKDMHHYIVFTECINPDATDGKYEFTVCDSAANDPSMGDNVPFTECASYKNSGYRYESIVSVTTIDIVE